MTFRRVFVCGRREDEDWALILESLDKLAAELREEAARLGTEAHITIIHEGRMSGIGRYADGWAVANQASIEEYPPDWMPPGVQRNKRIMELGKPDVVLAVCGDAHSVHIVNLAIEAGTPIRLVRPSRRFRSKIAIALHAFNKKSR